MDKLKASKDPVCEAVKKLRTGIGDTQQQFATRLKLAISTVVRYELSRPPRGEILLQLAQVAMEHGLGELGVEFRFLYIGEFVENLGFQIIIDPLKSRGYLIEKLGGPDELDLAQSFTMVKSALSSTDLDIKEKASTAASELKKAAREIRANPVVDQLQDAIRALMAQGETK